VSDAIEGSGIDLSSFDAYVSGPRAAVVASAAPRHRQTVSSDRVFLDSFGLITPTDVA
jgi:hypothetical protein